MAAMLSGCSAQPDGAPYHDLAVNGSVWLRTVTPTYSADAHKSTYKPFTHIIGEMGEAITKGVGGIDTHHRGMYIGWNEVKTGSGVWDFWHMKAGVSQRCVSIDSNGTSHQEMLVEWVLSDGRPVITETRAVSCSEGANGERVFDFTSVLSSRSGDIRLRGDAHHAGMHVRMANQVFWHQWSTRYVLPAAATESMNNIVENARWVCCSPVVDGTRYWLLHMTHPSTIDGAPLYSTRRYGRFGSFFTTDLQEDTPRTLRFRVVYSAKPLARADCERLFTEYVTGKE